MTSITDILSSYRAFLLHQDVDTSDIKQSLVQVAITFEQLPKAIQHVFIKTCRPWQRDDYINMDGVLEILHNLVEVFNPNNLFAIQDSSDIDGVILFVPKPNFEVKDIMNSFARQKNALPLCSFASTFTIDKYKNPKLWSRVTKQ
jgi:hypothetical protein